MNVRPFNTDDFAAVAKLLEDDERSFGRRADVSVNNVHEWTQFADLSKDSWLYEDDEGVAAAGWFFVYGSVGVGIGVVHPRMKARGIGSELLDRSDAALRGREIEKIHQFAIGSDTAAHGLLESRGYQDARHFFEMAIELSERPQTPDATIETFSGEEDDARAFHHALEEAFQDHWEHHDEGFDKWWDRQRANPSYDPTLWFLIRDGDEIAATCRNEGNRNGGGYVAALGVRRPWRGKGYAKALLLHAFCEFWDRDMRRVTLGVDAESPTGATHLYERVGMHVESENIVFEKVLEQ
jgi:GNAT superfamily N-acetyltransferase